MTMWLADAPPLTAGSEDDEFADASAGLPSGWSEMDHGADLTVGEDEAGLTLTLGAFVGPGSAGVYKAIPAGDFTIWAKFSVHGHQVDLIPNPYAGLCLMEDATDSTKALHWIGAWTRDVDTRLGYYTQATWATAVATVTDHIAGNDLLPTMFYARLRRTGTTYSWDLSSDGVGWLRFSSGTIAITPAHFGVIAGLHNTNSAGGRVDVQFFRYVASDVGTLGTVGGDRINFAGLPPGGGGGGTPRNRVRMAHPNWDWWRRLNWEQSQLSNLDFAFVGDPSADPWTAWRSMGRRTERREVGSEGMRAQAAWISLGSPLPITFNPIAGRTVRIDTNPSDAPGLDSNPSDPPGLDSNASDTATLGT